MKRTTSKEINRKFAEKARRENELEMYGRILSTRPSYTFESKKKYNRKREKRRAYTEF